jgi:hypothetical protein
VNAGSSLLRTATDGRRTHNDDEIAAMSSKPL